MTFFTDRIAARTIKAFGYEHTPGLIDQVEKAVEASHPQDSHISIQMCGYGLTIPMIRSKADMDRIITFRMSNGH